MIYEKINEENKTTVIIKSLDGIVLHTIVNYNGTIYLDGELFEYGYPKTIDLEPNEMSINSNWGPWLRNTEYIPTGGLTTAVIAGLIVAKAGWTPLGIVAAVATVTAGKYDEIQIQIQIRYRNDGTYHYYERVTEFFGDGSRIVVPGNPYRDNGKTYLK